jgi:hypothetical protein
MQRCEANITSAVTLRSDTALHCANAQERYTLLRCAQLLLLSTPYTMITALTDALTHTLTTETQNRKEKTAQKKAQ